MPLIAATNPSLDGTAPFVLFTNDDVAAAALIAALVAQGIPASGLIGAGAILLPALTPTLAALITLLLGIAHAHLGAAIRTDAELDGGLSQRRGSGQEA